MSGFESRQMFPVCLLLIHIFLRCRSTVLLRLERYTNYVKAAGSTPAPDKKIGIAQGYKQTVRFVALIFN